MYIDYFFLVELYNCLYRDGSSGPRQKGGQATYECFPYFLQETSLNGPRKEPESRQPQRHSYPWRFVGKPERG